MGKLVRAELYKLSRSAIYKLLLAGYFFIVVNAALKSIAVDNILYTGAEWFYKMPGSIARRHYADWLIIFAAYYVAGDFENRTLGEKLLCGFSRRKVIWAKIVVFFLGMLPTALMYALVETIIRTVWFGFGTELSVAAVLFIAKMSVYWLLGILVFGSGYFLCAVLVRNRIAAVCVSFIGCRILGIVAGNIEFMENPTVRKPLEFIYQFTIYWQLGELNGGHPYIHIPFELTVVSSSMATVFMVLASVYVFVKRDLK